MPEKYSLFLLLALLAEIVGTVSGFGSSILFVPIASLFFDFKLVLGITALFHVFSNLSKLYLFREGIRRDIVWKLGLPAVAAVVAGALLTRYIPQKESEVLMNMLLLILAVILFIRHNKALRPSLQNLIGGGLLSGFLAGLVGTGGAIRGLTLAAFQLEKNSFIATSAFIDLFVDSSRAVVYVYHQYFQQQHLILLPFLALVSLLGSRLGQLILKQTSEKAFRTIVLLVVAATALFQLSRYFWFA
ncbi:MAG: sulfite exporter TauE/SafE family protein [Chitinophagaceae bacterium]|nr:sulfite exporter TauE/SafE family protein [Chitinophagaceae bacterium]